MKKKIMTILIAVLAIGLTTSASAVSGGGGATGGGDGGPFDRLQNMIIAIKIQLESEFAGIQTFLDELQTQVEQNSSDMTSLESRITVLDGVPDVDIDGDGILDPIHTDEYCERILADQIITAGDFLCPRDLNEEEPEGLFQNFEKLYIVVKELEVDFEELAQDLDDETNDLGHEFNNVHADISSLDTRVGDLEEADLGDRLAFVESLTIQNFDKEPIVYAIELPSDATVGEFFTVRVIYQSFYQATSSVQSSINILDVDGQQIKHRFGQAGQFGLTYATADNLLVNEPGTYTLRVWLESEFIDYPFEVIP